MAPLRREILRFLDEEGVSLAGKTVLCAVSGGRDSMALLCLMLELSTKLGFAVAAAHYNHRLRESAERDENFVRDWCGRKGVPLIVGSGDVAAFASEKKTSVEDAARVMRYRFLEDAADELGADYIATAHHAQDNAETILLHLLRGAGLQGLSGIPPVRGRIIRPLLETSRSSINSYIDENGIPYVEDETNSETVYERNRLRHELLPRLEELSPGAVTRIAAAAARLRADNASLEARAAALLPPGEENGETRLRRELLKTQDAAIAARLVRLAARRFDVELTAAQVDAIRALRRGGLISLPDGLRAAAEGEIVRFYRLPAPPPPLALRIGEQKWGEYLVFVRETDGEAEERENVVVLRADAGELTIRAWDGTGRLAVENGSRTVKRLLSDHGITAPQQENRPAVLRNGELAAVFGAGADYSLRPESGEKKIVITLVSRGKKP